MECYSFLSNLTSYCSAYLYDTDPAIIKEVSSLLIGRF